MTPMIPERVIRTAAPVASGQPDYSIASGQGSFADTLQQAHQGDEDVPSVAIKEAVVGHGSDVVTRVVSVAQGGDAVKAILAKPADDDMDGNEPPDSGASSAITVVDLSVVPGCRPEGELQAVAETGESPAQAGFNTDVSPEAAADEISLWLQQANILAPMPAEPAPAAGPVAVSTRQELAAGGLQDIGANGDGQPLPSATGVPSMTATGTGLSVSVDRGEPVIASPRQELTAGAPQDVDVNGDGQPLPSAAGLPSVTETGTGALVSVDMGEDGLSSVDESSGSPVISRRLTGTNNGRLPEPDGGSPAAPIFEPAQQSPEGKGNGAAVVMMATGAADEAKPDQSGDLSTRALSSETESSESESVLQASVPVATTAALSAEGDPGPAPVRAVAMHPSVGIRPGDMEATTVMPDRGGQQPRSLDLASSATPGRITEQVQMLLSQEKQQLELKLHPSELGHLHIKLQLQQDQAQVHFMVQNGQAREALEQALPRLREMLADAGIQLGQSGVEQQRHEQPSGDGRGQQAAHRSGSGWRAANDPSGDDGRRVQITQLPAGRDGRVDYFA